MVFWKNYPLIKNYFTKSYFTKSRFLDLLFERDTIQSPTGKNAIFINNSNTYRLNNIQLFIKTYFGSPSNTPILDIPIDKLLSEKDHILYVTDIDNNIVGCIRYHYIGNFISDRNQDIYCEDCFCIHPKWRKKGVGEYLLTTLHNYVNKKNIPYSIFLKEGSPLNIFNLPFYSSIYVYKNPIKPINTVNIINLSIEDAYKLVEIFRELNPDTFIILNKYSKNQIWKMYKKNNYFVLVCFQDTYQIIEDKNKKQKQKIGWITAWIESPNITDSISEDASNALVDSMYSNYDYIWINKEWITKNQTNWNIDGPFHWYLYQWTTSISIKKNYCLLN
jgi:hypothetical protein